MGGQHKKHLRAEKAKVKLKGAKLPKGLNVTKTDFKVRKIEIREQLRESQLNELGQRQLNLKEILSRLRHHSVKFRSDALRNIRDCIKLGQAAHLIGHLNDILQGIATVALDMEPDARRESFKTLDALLEALPYQAVSPFFHILATFLRCAMTHVRPGIQEDSLLLLDVLLQRVPANLLAERSASIIANFIDMISRARHDNERTNRTLTINLGHGEQTGIKWRTKVLMRLQQIFNILVHHNPTTTTTTTTTTTSSNSTNNSQIKTFTFDENSPQYYGISQTAKNHINLINVCDIFNKTDSKRYEYDEQLRSYIKQLMPLLFDNWLEVRPQQQQQHQQQQQQNKHDKPLLTIDGAISMRVLLNIIIQLWQLIIQCEKSNSNSDLSDWMRLNYSSMFMQNFLDCNDGNFFPYQQLPQTQKNKKKKQSAAAVATTDEYCSTQNLYIVQLVCNFCPTATPDKQTTTDEHIAYIYKSLLTYMMDCLDHQMEMLSPEQQLLLIKSLNALLYDNGELILKLHPELACNLLHKTIEIYIQQRCTTRDGCASRLLQLLCSILQNSTLYKMYGGDEQFIELLEYLPQLLLKSNINQYTIRVMTKLCQQLNFIFMRKLVINFNEIFDNFATIQVTTSAAGDYVNDNYDYKMRIINLFYYVKDAEKQQITEMLLNREIATTNTSTNKYVDYLKNILKYP